MSWGIEYTDEFGEWWTDLTEEQQLKVAAVVDELEEHGPHLSFPLCSGISTSRHAHMRELRIQVSGRPFRVLYAFNPERNAILLIGGDKTGDDRWYDWMVPIADKLYDQHLEELKRGKAGGIGHG